MIRKMTLVIALASLAAASLAAQEKGPLITKNHAKLTLGGAHAVIVAAKAKAEALKLNVNIAVADDGGHLIAFARMDGARPASVYTAMTKATAAATMRTATGPLPPGAEQANTHLSLAVERAAAASGGKVTTLYGGVPIVVDGQVIGAVGVGGATGEQDAEIAKAGIAALVEALKEEKK
jgi:glc operon protein GlcG